MLIAAFILVISIAAMMQFVVFAWRASLLRTVSERFVNESDATLQPHPDLLTSSSFQEVVSVYDELCPELEAGPTSNLRAVSFYYALMSFVNRVDGLFRRKASVGPIAKWPCALNMQRFGCLSAWNAT